MYYDINTLIKDYQQSFEKLTLVRKAAADHELDNTFSKDVHEMVSNAYTEDINRLTDKLTISKERLEYEYKRQQTVMDSLRR